MTKIAIKYLVVYVTYSTCFRGLHENHSRGLTAPRDGFACNPLKSLNIYCVTVDLITYITRFTLVFSIVMKSIRVETVYDKAITKMRLRCYKRRYLMR